MEKCFRAWPHHAIIFWDFDLESCSFQPSFCDQSVAGVYVKNMGEKGKKIALKLIFLLKTNVTNKMGKLLKNCCSYCTDFSLLKWGVDISCWETCPKLSLEDFYEVMLQSVCVCKWCSSISDGCQWWQISSNEIESSQQGSIIILHSNSSLFMMKWNFNLLEIF